MKYKSIPLILSLSIAPLMVSAQLSYTFLDKGSVFDLQTSVEETFGSLTITATASGGVFNSNRNNFGIDDTSIDGTSEGLSLSFSQTVEISRIDFGSIGSNIDDGVKLTTSANPPLDLSLYTGIVGFNGTTDTYVPATPIRLEVGETISFTGSSNTAAFEIHSFNYTVIPEMSAQSLATGAAGLILVFMSRLLRH